MSDDDRDWLGDLPELHAEPMHDTSLPTLKQVEARLSGRFQPMTKWALIVGLMHDHKQVHRDLLARLALWPVQARQHRTLDDPAERQQRAEGHARGVARRMAARAKA